MSLLNHPELDQFILLQEIFQRYSQTMHLFVCFSQYQKHLCGTIPFKTFVNLAKLSTKSVSHPL